MIGVATTIKDNLLHALFFGALSHKLANFARQRNFSVIGNGGKSFNGRFIGALLSGWQYYFGLRLGTAFLLTTLLRLTTFCLGLRGLLHSFSPLASRQSLCRRLYQPGSFLCYALQSTTYFLRRRGIALYFKIMQARIQRRGGCQRPACGIVYDLCIDMVSTTEYIQAWTCL